MPSHALGAGAGTRIRTLAHTVRLLQLDLLLPLEALDAANQASVGGERHEHHQGEQHEGDHRLPDLDHPRRGDRHDHQQPDVGEQTEHGRHSEHLRFVQNERGQNRRH